MKSFVSFQKLRSLALGALLCAPLFAQPAPPPQPTFGPGGSDYPNTSVTQQGPFQVQGQAGNTAYSYFVLQPGTPTPASAPVVLFIHGSDGDTLTPYKAWMQHMAKKGFTVIWITYDAGTTTDQYASVIVACYKDALQRITTQPGFVLPLIDSNKAYVTGVVGHSSGGFLAFSVAALLAAPGSGLPQFRAIVSIEPGQGAVPASSISGINAATKVLFLVGDVDKSDRQCDAVNLWSQLPQARAKNFLKLQSDILGVPQQLGNHWFPLTSSNKDTANIDNRDYNAVWKLSVGALSCVFSGTYCDYGFGSGGPNQVQMGFWSDGTPVLPLIYYANPVTAYGTQCPPPQ